MSIHPYRFETLVQPLFISASAILPTTIWPIPADHDHGERAFAHPEIQVALSGEGSRWLLLKGRSVEVKTRPGMVEMYDAGYEIGRTRWLGRKGDYIAIQFPTPHLERLLHESGPSLHLISAHELFDQRISHVCAEIAHECKRGMPGGALYAEGLSIALVGLLRSSDHSHVASHRTTGLSSSQRRCVLECIEAELGSALTIDRLSAVVGLSPATFARRFKTSFGQTPHQFVLRRRIEVASDTLRRDPFRPISDLAYALGFSSQSHFSEAFLKITGMPPGRFRRA